MNTQKTLQFIFPIVILFFSCASSFAHDIEVDNIYYNISSDSTLEVTFKGNYDTQYTEYFDTVSIPTYVSYNNNLYTVTSVGNNAFYNCKTVTTVNLPESINSIKSYAFCNCIKLDSITGANYISIVGNGAFTNTKWFSKQPKGFVYFRNVLYKYTDELPKNTAINIADGIISISDGTFRGFSNITSITFPQSLKIIGAAAFQNCNGLTHITIPDNVTSIGVSAFESCKNLRYANIPKSVTYLGGRLFYDCTLLETLLYDAANCRSIDYAGKGNANAILSGCSSLKTIIIGENATTIPGYCFYAAPNIERVISLSKTPSKGHTSNFNWDIPSKATLYIPSQNHAPYFLDSFWGSFNITKIDPATSSLNFNIINIEIPLGQQKTIRARITPENSTLTDLLWFSSDPSIARVDSRGNIDGISEGVTTIYAQTIDGSNLFAYCNVSVGIVKASDISISKSTINLPVNETCTLNYSISPDNTSNKTVTWATNNKSIADFKTNSNGSITLVGVSDGVATITATTNDGTNLTASCVVTVGIGGVDDIEADNDIFEVARYDIHGRLLNKPAKGVNIIKMSNGSTHKEFIK